MDGNKLEKRTKDILEKDAWQVLANADYKDPLTGKPCEKDIIATKPQFPTEDILKYNVKLFIECKYFPKTTEIYAKGKNMDEIENTILALNIPFADVPEIERGKETHFYQYTEIFELKDKKDFLYRPIKQNLQSFNAFRKDNPEKALCYLIVIYDGELISVDRKEDKKSCNNALVEKETFGPNVYGLPRKKCFIELVSINEFENFLKKIEEDIKKINFSAQFYYNMEKNKFDENKRKIRNEKRES